MRSGLACWSSRPAHEVVNLSPALTVVPVTVCPSISVHVAREERERVAAERLGGRAIDGEEVHARHQDFVDERTARELARPIGAARHQHERVRALLLDEARRDP